MHSVSFSLVRFFWTSKRNEQTMSRELKHKPSILYINNPTAPGKKITRNPATFWQHFRNKTGKTSTILFQPATNENPKEPNYETIKAYCPAAQ
jgi:hypothetical protein